jgi:regulator of chromosome condensation
VAGDGFTFVLTEEGAVYGWGQFKDDVCSTKQFSPTVKLQRLPARVYQPESARDAVTKLASGERGGGLLLGPRRPSCGSVVGGPTGACAERAACPAPTGVGHVAALTRRGEVLTWGMGTQGQLGRVAPYTVRDPPPLTALLTPSAVPGIGAAIGPEVVDIGCGHYSTYAVSKRGGVAAWGLNNMGQLGLAVIVEGEAAAAAAAGDGQANGHAAAAANGDAGGPINHAVWAPQAVPGLTKGVSAAAGGEHHALLLHKASSVLSCGRSLYGMLGRAAAADDAALPEPQPVDATDGLAGEKPVSVAAGMNVSACVTAEVRGQW